MMSNEELCGCVYKGEFKWQLHIKKYAIRQLTNDETEYCIKNGKFHRNALNYEERIYV